MINSTIPKMTPSLIRLHDMSVFYRPTLGGHAVFCLATVGFLSGRGVRKPLTRRAHHCQGDMICQTLSPVPARLALLTRTSTDADWELVPHWCWRSRKIAAQVFEQR